MFGKSLALVLPGILFFAGSALAQNASRPGASIPTAPTSVFAGTNALGQRHTELVGVTTQGFPEFTFVQAFNAGDSVAVGIDVHRLGGLAGKPLDLYVIDHRSPSEWRHDRSLVGVNGGPIPFTPSMGSLGDNVVQVDAGGLNGFSGTAELGIGYDLVLDVNRNGFFDADDFIDGWGHVAGFYVMPKLLARGPYGTSLGSYNGGPFRRQQIFYPSQVDSLGQLPLVVVSHGNGHNYRWYDHIGNHLSSWGYIVMSHENETGPGIQTASESTLLNTDLFLNNLDLIANGALQGHVDQGQMVWLGHSRGGEGVAWAYNQLVNGTPFPVSYSAQDVRLVSSIAPTDFLGTGLADPLDVPYHLWTGGADDDVHGCADNDIAQTFHLHDRAQGERMSISLHGVGHGDFHNNNSSSVADGPCLVGRTRTHRVMRGYLLPLLDAVLNDHAHSREYLWRQYESFRPIAPNSSSCIVADLMYRPDPKGLRYVVDDFQTNPARIVSSSGGVVSWDVVDLWEARLDDRNTSFLGNTGDRFNGITLGSNMDNTRGIVFEFGTFDSNFIDFELPGQEQDLSSYRFLSFRACQISRNALTVAERGDLDFSVALVDAGGNQSEVRIGAYGGGLEEPYQRTGCGLGAGWTSEWETIRIPVMDFVASGRVLNLKAIRNVNFRFGASHGSDMGRLGLDEIEFTSK